MRIKGIKIDEDVARILNEQDNDFPEGSFAAWYGEDLTGQTYEGDLVCSSQNLTSLFGCPSVVIGRFSCCNNKLKTLILNYMDNKNCLLLLLEHLLMK